MGKENYTDIDNEMRTNIDNEVMIHPAFIRFVLSRPGCEMWIITKQFAHMRRKRV